MADTETALKLEKLRRDELFRRLTNTEGEQILKAGMGDRSHTASGRLIDETEAVRRDKFEAVIDGYVQIRRDLSANFPELCADSALDLFEQEMIALIDPAFYVPPSGGRFPLPPDSVPMERRYHNRELKERVQNKLGILRHESALKLHMPEVFHSVNVNTGGGPAIVNLGQIHGDLTQVVGTLNASGHAELAGHLERLATAIENMDELGVERSTYLEQLRFVAQQAIEPEDKRQASVERVVFESLRARLQ